MNLRAYTMEDAARDLGHVRVIRNSNIEVSPALTVAALRDVLAAYEDTAIVYIETPWQTLVVTDEGQPFLKVPPGEAPVIRARSFDDRDAS